MPPERDPRRDPRRGSFFCFFAFAAPPRLPPWTAADKEKGPIRFQADRAFSGRQNGQVGSHLSSFEAFEPLTIIPEIAG